MADDPAEPGDRPRRVGLLGGTFDPPHLGHLIVARDVAEALELDAIRFVVANVPPHKPGRRSDEPGRGRFASPELRARMVERALEGDALLEASRVELEREGPSYTVDTLRVLREREPEVAWTLVMGADQWADFASWRAPGEIAGMARIAVMTRRGNDPEAVEPPELDIDYDVVDVTRVDLSSTRIRERVAEGRTIRYRVPDAVRRIIEDAGLYRDQPC